MSMKSVLIDIPNMRLRYDLPYFLILLAQVRQLSGDLNYE
jgi:hypothetical protein